MRYLVTGGAGVLGANLCLKLLRQGHEVVALDNLSTGHNILSHVKGYDFIEASICRPPHLERVDGIFNLACPASPLAYQARPVATWRASTLGMDNMLSLASRWDCPILQASTSEVYGDPTEHPQAETYWGNVNPIGFRSCYDESKRASETICMDFYREMATRVRIVRIFNTYGPRMSPNDGRVVSNFITQALRKEPLTIYGSGNQTRSFCYVDDLVDGLIARMASEYPGPVNLGNPTEFTIAKLAENINLLVGNTAGIVFKPLPSDDPRQRRPDISLAQKLLGWKPKVSLYDGLAKTVDWFRSGVA